MILVTGAGGFIGRALVDALLKAKRPVRAVTRAGGRQAPPGVNSHMAVDLETIPTFDGMMQGVDTIVHLSGRAHRVPAPGEDAWVSHRRANRDATLRLAEAAQQCGISRFVFLSSAAAIPVEQALTEGRITQAAARQAHPYETAKLEAEAGLLSLYKQLPVVILRPPLVHGPGAVANFALLERAVKGRWPMPLGGVKNRRSLIGIDNLVSAILAVLDHPQAPGRIFPVADAEALSTPELIRRMARATSRKPPLLLPIPPAILAHLFRWSGRPGWAERLTGDAVVEGAAIYQAIGWTPPLSLDQGLARLSEQKSLTPKL